MNPSPGLDGMGSLDEFSENLQYDMLNITVADLINSC